MDPDAPCLPSYSGFQAFIQSSTCIMAEEMDTLTTLVPMIEDLCENLYLDLGIALLRSLSPGHAQGLNWLWFISAILIITVYHFFWCSQYVVAILLYVWHSVLLGGPLHFNSTLCNSGINLTWCSSQANARAWWDKDKTKCPAILAACTFHPKPSVSGLPSMPLHSFLENHVIKGTTVLCLDHFKRARSPWYLILMSIISIFKLTSS